MTRRRGVLLLTGATVLVGLVGAAVWATRTDGGNDTAAASPGPHNGRFHVECGYSHSAPDDPIVFPGEPGASHQHDFFGATTTDAFSDADSLLAGGTTCATRQDKASYWAPSLFAGDEQLVPLSSTAYYRAADGVEPTAVEPFPFGLMMISGDPTATVTQPTDHVGWACTVEAPTVSTPPDCGAQLLLRVTFPDCWNGEDLDSEDHRSHMARSSADGCPDTHPVALPELEFHVAYPPPQGRADLHLASGSILTAHADFFNAWEPAKLANEVQVCVAQDAYCWLGGRFPCGDRTAALAFPVAGSVSVDGGTTMGTPWRRVTAAVVVLAAVASGCGGDDGAPSSGTLRVPDDFGTIQEAVDAAEPGSLILIEPGTYEEAVDVTTEDLVIRGQDRNQVVLDGGFDLENGIRVLEVDGVVVENLTVRNYTNNGVFWTGVDGYRASYVSAIRNGVYGIYAFGSVNGTFEHSYASGSADGGFYIGQCFPCNAVVDDVVAEWNGLGFSDTDAGGDLFVVNSVFRENRVGFVAASATFEGCYPQRETTFVGNQVVDNGNDQTAAVGVALLAEGVGVGVGGGIGNVIEANVVSGNPRAGIAVIPFPEYDAIAPIPAPEDRPVDCVADTVAASEEVIAGLDNPLIWPPEDNQVRGNDVADNGEWDVVALTLDGEAHGNCFEDNVLAADAVLSPPDIEAVLPCDGEAQTYSPELARFLEIVERELPEAPSYQDVDLPDPGPLPGMDDPEGAPAEAAGPPPPVDLEAITRPGG